MKLLEKTTDCVHPQHDHEVVDGKPAVCGDCGLPMYYDEAILDYRHSDPTAPRCFLIGETLDPNSRCVFAA